MRSSVHSSQRDYIIVEVLFILYRGVYIGVCAFSISNRCSEALSKTLLYVVTCSLSHLCCICERLCRRHESAGQDRLNTGAITTDGSTIATSLVGATLQRRRHGDR